MRPGGVSALTPTEEPSSAASPLELRPGRLDHPDAVALVEEVQRYYVEVYGGPDDDPLSPEEFAPPTGVFLIGYVDGLAVAMGGWTRTPARTGVAQLRRMFVSPHLRRRGLAGQLLDRLEGDARAAGVRLLVLTTGRRQRAAVALYRDHGYVDVDPFGYYADAEGAVHLGKALGPAPGG